MSLHGCPSCKCYDTYRGGEAVRPGDVVYLNLPEDETTLAPELVRVRLVRVVTGIETVNGVPYIRCLFPEGPPFAQLAGMPSYYTLIMRGK